MIIKDNDSLAEVLANEYEFDMELTAIGVHIYKDDLTLDDMIAMCKLVENLLVVEYQKDYIVLSLS